MNFEQPADSHTELKLHKPANRNTTWVNGQGFWFLYIAILVAVRLLLWAAFEPVTGWNAWNVGHAVVTFFIFHWIKGTPFSNEGTYVSESKYSKLTLWEQIDSGVQYTPTRKFLTLVPVIMFLITSHYTNHHFTALLINTVAFVVITIAKQPFMIKKRLFGINE